MVKSHIGHEFAPLHFFSFYLQHLICMLLKKFLAIGLVYKSLVTFQNMFVQKIYINLQQVVIIFGWKIRSLVVMGIESIRKSLLNRLR